MKTTTIKKYWALLTISWENGLVYRMSVFMWRLRRFLAAVMALTIWSTIYTSAAPEATTFGYAQSDMISYIFLISILQSLVLATALNGLAQDVYSGAISNQLLKPLSLTVYLIMQDLADKLKNASALLFEIIALFLIFKPVVHLPDLATLGIFIVWTLAAIVLNFCISLLFGSLGFWSPETWAPRFLFYTLLQFTAGQLFPLDVLPTIFQKVMYATPFPYLSFVQTQLFLQKLTLSEIQLHSMVLLGWVAVLAFLAQGIWKRGLRDYDAAGR